MIIRKAEKNDIPFLESSLCDICKYHNAGRPDIFRDGGVKYTEAALEEVIKKDIVLVAFDGEEPCGYLIAQRERYDDTVRQKYSSIYVDDLYVKPEKRRLGVGKQLMEAIFSAAKQEGCYNVTLNVWEFPGSAMEFYKNLGMKPMSHKMEIIL